MTRFIRAALVSMLCTGLVPTLATAQNKLKAMVIVDGTCKKLVVQGKDRTADCTGKLLNTEYAGGRIGFYFVTSEGGAFTFSARGDEQVKPDADTAVAPVDSVIVGLKGKSDSIKATGTCKFTNPYRGVPAPIECAVDTARGRYEGVFLSDGSKPDSKTFD